MNLNKIDMMFNEACEKGQCNPNVADWIMEELKFQEQEDNKYLSEAQR